MALGAQIRKYRIKAGLTLEALSDASGVEVGTISALEKRDSSRSAFFGPLAAALGMTMEQLGDAGTDHDVKALMHQHADPSALSPPPKLRNEMPNVEPGPDIKGKGRYPLISWVQAGEWTELCDNFQPGDAEDWPVSHHNLGACGYMLRVKGDSMTAPAGSQFSFPDGVLLHVNPDKEAVAGQFVVVRRTAEKEATFKRLAMVDGELFLEAINPEWPRRYLQLKEGDVFCGVVVDASFGNLP